MNTLEILHKTLVVWIIPKLSWSAQTVENSHAFFQCFLYLIQIFTYWMNFILPWFTCFLTFLTCFRVNLIVRIANNFHTFKDCLVSCIWNVKSIALWMGPLNLSFCNSSIRSTLNIWKKVLTKVIWADEKWAGFWQISLCIK